MESKKINQLATAVNPSTSDLAIIGDPVTGVSKKITWLQVSTLIGTAANLQQVTDNGATTTNPVTIGGLTITGLSTGVLKSDSGVISSVPFGAANGVATLAGDGKVPSNQLPSYVDDVVEVANYAALPVTGETGKIYITLDNNKVYRWGGSVYVEVAANQAVWGSITGTLANQTDLQNVLNLKATDSLVVHLAGTETITGTKTFSNPSKNDGGILLQNGSSYSLSGYMNLGGMTDGLRFTSGGGISNFFTLPSSVGYTYTFPALSGTIVAISGGNSTQYIDGTGALQTFPTLISSDKLVKLVRNQSGATMTAGTIVYISGATGNKPLITKALATGDSTSAQTYGLVQANIANNADGYVVVIGNITDIDTSALTEGQQLYLSGTTAGAYTTTKPYAPIHLVYIGIVLRSHPTQGIIGVKIQNGYEMDELHNVDAYAPSNNDILSYNTTTSLWEHKQIATTLGFTPISLASLSATSPLSYNNTTGAFSIQVATASQNGYLSSTDWSTFNNKQAALGGTGFVKITGSTISYDNSTYYLASNPSGYITLASLSAGAGISYSNTTGVISSTITQYTDALARAAISSSATGLTYTSATGVFSLTAGYSIPTTAKQTEWDTAYTNRITSLTTTGSSGAATLVSNTLNVPTYTLSGLGGQPLDADLTAIAALAGTSGFLKKTAADTWALDTNTYLTTSSAASTYVPYTGATGSIDLGLYDLNSRFVFVEGGSGVGATLGFKQTSLGSVSTTNHTNIYVQNYNIIGFTFYQASAFTKDFRFDVSNLSESTTRTYTMPNASGTLALTSDIVTYTLPTASTSVLGGVKVDGTTITINGSGVISGANTYSLPIATASVLGGVKIGSGVSVDVNGVISVSTNYQAPITLTTTGTSGAATFSSGTLNIPQYQAALTNPVTGTGSIGRVAYWSSLNSITSEGDFVWDSTNNRLGIGTDTPASSIHIIEPTAARIRLQTGATGAALLDFHNGTTARFSIGVDNNQAYGKLENRGLGYDIFRFYDATNNVAIVPTNGNVLIGTTTDVGYKLDVNGGARFIETIVSNATSSAFSRVVAAAGRDSLTFYDDGNYTAGVGLNYGTNPNKFVIYFNSGTALTFNTSRQATFTNSVSASYFHANASLSVGLIGANTTFIDNAGGTSRFLSYGSNSSTRGSIDFFQASSTNTLQQTPLSIAANGNSTFIGNVGINGAPASIPLMVKVDTNLMFRVDTYLSTTNLASINAAQSAYMAMKIDGTTLQLNTQTGGNVGIGQIAPSVLLDLKKSHASGYGNFVDLINLNGFFPGYDVDAQRAGIAAGVPNLGNTTYGWISFRTRGSGGYLDRMIVTPVGVYINTATELTGGGALQVNGNVNINGVFQINGTTIGGGGGSGVTGSGTTGYITKWSGSTSLGNSILYDDGSRLTLQSGTGQNDTYGYMQVYYDGSGTSPNAGYTTKNYSGTSQMMQWTIYGLRFGSRIMTNSGQGSIVFTHGNDSVGMTLFGSSGNLNVGSGNSDSGYKLKVEGSIYATADVIAYSDISVKKNIRTIENALERVTKSRGVIYDRKDIDSNNNIGFIAQELELEFPELISKNSDGTKGVKYQNAVAVLFEAIKEQQKQINELKKQSA